MSLRRSLATAEGRQRYVRRLFATIANRYDLITVLLSGGLDERWKERLVGFSRVSSATQALDLACGTGDITFKLADRGARTTGLDVTARMIELAKQKCTPQSRPRFVVGDMMHLPFGDGQFDIVTSGYGIRNVPVLQQSIAEIQRVLKPGGQFLSLDFNRPTNAVVRAVYLTYLTVVGSTLGLVLHRDPDTYRYIPESIRRYPGAAAVCEIIRHQGFKTCAYVPVLGGLMAIHRAEK